MITRRKIFEVLGVTAVVFAFGFDIKHGVERAKETWAAPDGFVEISAAEMPSHSHSISGPLEWPTGTMMMQLRPEEIENQPFRWRYVIWDGNQWIEWDCNEGQALRRRLKENLK